VVYTCGFLRSETFREIVRVVVASKNDKTMFEGRGLLLRFHDMVIYYAESFVEQSPSYQQSHTASGGKTATLGRAVEFNFNKNTLHGEY